MYFKESGAMTGDEKLIRSEVFIKEQKFEDEYDDFDLNGTHIVMYSDKNTPVGCCRMITKNGKNFIGRIAVLKQYRGQSLGTQIVEHAIEILRKRGVSTVYVAAQTRARGFYESLGFTAFGDEFFEEYCPHINMKKKI